jgi:hypothetical protein
MAEAACKTVGAIWTRRSGMRWTHEGLDVTLVLHPAALYKEFERCWQAYREAVL